MKILVACEESQAICLALRAKGHDAYSCDLQECSGGHPEWHYKGSLWDIIDAKDGVEFITESGHTVYIKGWDALIGHPPCTYLSNAGNDWFNLDKYISAQQRWLNRFEAIEFFCKMFHKDIPRICLENPVGFMNGIWPPNQIIEPFFFGDSDRKRTCLWTKGFPNLVHLKHNDIWGQKNPCRGKANLC
jgi:hypothetical protein